jgi:hypothetical protein
MDPLELKAELVAVADDHGWSVEEVTITQGYGPDANTWTEYHLRPNTAPGLLARLPRDDDDD